MSLASKIKTQYDGAAAVLLRNVGDGAETATATETAVALNMLDTAYWHNDEVPHGVLEAVFHVTALDLAQADETYTLALVVDDVAAMNDTPLVVWSQTITATGVYYAYVDSKNVEKVVTDKSGTDLWIAARATLGGTSPSITYGAWIAKSRGA